MLTTVDMIISQLSSEGSEPVANALASVLNTIGFEVTGEQIAALGRIAGEKAVALIRKEPADPTTAAIVETRI